LIHENKIENAIGYIESILSNILGIDRIEQAAVLFKFSLSLKPEDLIENQHNGSRHYIHLKGLTDLLDGLDQDNKMKLRIRLIDLHRKMIVELSERSYKRGVTESLNKDDWNRQNGKHIDLNSKNWNGTKYILVYVLILLVTIGVSVYLLNSSVNADATVSIEYNIGEIIGALLVGFGVSFVGFAYAKKILDKGDDN